MESFLLLASFYLGAAVLIVPLSVRFGLGSVLGYLAAGILLGPILGLAGAETQDLQHFAEFGVVMMLFLIGLELEPRTLWDMRHKLVGLGGAQVALTAGAIGGLLYWIGQPAQVAVTLGLLMALSSTAIVLQTLSEKNLMRTAGGRASFAVLLTQDIAVVPMLALIPLLAPSHLRGGDTHATEGAAEPLLSLIQSLPGWAVTLLTLAIVAAIVLVGHFLTRPVFRFVHASRLPEMSTFISLLMVLGIAFLMMLVGLSPALGTFVAGVVLANSEFRHQLEADIKPFKGILMGLFFMTVGVSIDAGVLFHSPFTILGLTLALIAVKALVLLALSLVFKVRGRDRWLFALGLAQAGEFGFLIVSFAVGLAILPASVAQLALMVISLSMLLTPALFIAHDRLARRFARNEPGQPSDEIDEKGTVIIAGLGRFGQVINWMSRTAGVHTVALDADMEAIETIRRIGGKGFYGDPTRPELLHAAGLDEAQVIVVAVDDPRNAVKIVEIARKARPDIHIIARARNRENVYQLYRAGANDIIRETFDSSVRAGRYVLENMGFTEYEAAKMSQAYYKVDRAALRDLAELWVPGLPMAQNAAYLARARRLEEDLLAAAWEELETPPSAAEPASEPETDPEPEPTREAAE